MVTCFNKKILMLMQLSLWEHHFLRH